MSFLNSRRARVYAIIALLPVANAQAEPVGKFYVLEAGIYKAETARRVAMAGTTGFVNLVKSITLQERTTSVPARRGVRFGLRYVVDGFPGPFADITFVVHFPSVGLRDPVTGQHHLRSIHSKPTPVGLPLYREYLLEHDWEAVPGTWRFEFWHAGRMLGEQVFCLFPVLRPGVDDSSTEIDRECVADLISEASPRRRSLL